MILKDGRELTIRRMEKADAPELIKYMKLVLGESDNLLSSPEGFTWTVEQEEEYIENAGGKEASALFAGLVDGRIISCSGILALDKERVAHLGEVGLSVLKEFWGLGVGTCMLEEIIRFARETGKLEVLFLGTKAENARAIELYKKFGFCEFGRFPGFFKVRGEYFDEIEMFLRL